MFPRSFFFYVQAQEKQRKNNDINLQMTSFLNYPVTQRLFIHNSELNNNAINIM